MTGARIWNRTERGWPGHFILGARCAWHRNTLLELSWLNDTRPARRVIVSSVGRLRIMPMQDHCDEIGGNGRYMETMIFMAQFEEPFWEIDVARQLPPPAEWFSLDASRQATLEYERIHVAAVAHYSTMVRTLTDNAWAELMERIDDEP